MVMLLTVYVIHSLLILLQFVVEKNVKIKKITKVQKKHSMS